MRVWIENRDRVNQAIDQFFGHTFHSVTSLIRECGTMAIFMNQSLKLIFVKPYRFDEIVKHMEFVGNRSISIIVLTGAFTGMALSYQIYLGFKMVGATNLVGPTVALGISKELGPVLTGLIVAARAGGAMAAQLGTMRVSEQIDAVEVMGIDPRQLLVAPRILAALIVTPLLCAIFDFVSMVGAHLLCVNVLGLDEAIFWDKVSLWINPGDLNEGLIKAAAFGLIFSSLCTSKGFYTTGGAKGVGEATNQGVVNSMVLIIVSNFFLTNLVRLYYRVTGL